MPTRKSPKKSSRKKAEPQIAIDPLCPADCELGPLTGQPRAEAARDRRKNAAEEEFGRLFPTPGAPAHNCNGDEVLYQTRNFIGSFTKGLPHNDSNGEVDPQAYCALLRAINSGRAKDIPPTVPRTDFEAVLLGCPNMMAQRKLENPQAGYAFDLEGADSHSLEIPAAPKFTEQDEVADVLENYWMALARDVPFTEYADTSAPSNALLTAAYNDLRRFTFYRPTNHFYSTRLTRQNLFRSFSAGDQVGPYVSQFLLLDTPYGAQRIPARIRTVLPGIDYMTSFREWLEVQNGCDASQSACDPTLRFIRNGRDLGQFVHVDLTFNAFLNAALILQSGREPLRRCEAAAGLGTPYDEDLPYINSTAPKEEEFPGKSGTQIGFVTFGAAHLPALLLEVMTRALKAVWYQKWQVHRRLRPEEFGGRIHVHLSGIKTYPIHNSVRTSPIFQQTGDYRIFEYNRRQNDNNRFFDRDDEGTHLLPQAFAEGSPIHPSYGAGHATAAGALATILKAFFPEDQRILNPVVPNPEGTALVRYTGEDADQITVGGEISKLASNISLGRNFAGVHWRSDHTESLRLGERVAISLLFDQRNTYNEDFTFRFTRFDGGSPVEINKASTVADLRRWLNT